MCDQCADDQTEKCVLAHLPLALTCSMKVLQALHFETLYWLAQ
jgi:hypothetical protein